MKKNTRQVILSINLLVVIAMVMGLTQPVPTLASETRLTTIRSTRIEPPAGQNSKRFVDTSDVSASLTLSPVGNGARSGVTLQTTQYYYAAKIEETVRLGTGGGGQIIWTDTGNTTGSQDGAAAELLNSSNGDEGCIVVSFGGTLGLNNGEGKAYVWQPQDVLHDMGMEIAVADSILSCGAAGWNTVYSNHDGVAGPGSGGAGWYGSNSYTGNIRALRIKVSSYGGNVLHEHRYFYIDSIRLWTDTYWPDPIPADRTYAPEDTCLANNPQASAADPVNTYTGNFTHQAVDVSVPTRGLPLAFERSYNSLDTYDGPLGPGWTHNYNMQLTFDGDVATLMAPRGSRLRFTDQGGGTFAAGAGVRASLVRNGDGSYSLTRGDQIVYTFGASGQLIALTDSNGNTTTLSYTSGQLTTITGPAGRTLTLTYNDQGRLEWLYVPLGRNVHYTYDPTGRLEYVTNLRGKTTRYGYDAAGRLETITDPNNHTVTNSYDGQGRVISQADPRQKATSFTYNGGQTVVTDARQHATTYIYDAIGRLEAVTDALQKTTHYTYDEDHNLTAVTDPLQRTTHYTWDTSSCKLASITDPLEGVTAMEYDARHNLTRLTDPLDRTTRFGYDAQDNLTVITNTLEATTTFTYDGYGQMLSSRDAEGHTTYYAYDGYGYLKVITQTVGALIYTTVYTHDAAGRLQQVRDARQYTTSFTYYPDDRLQTVTDARNGLTRYTYDDAGNLETVTDAENHTTTFLYYEDDQLRWVIDPLDKRTTYTYDDAGNLETVTDATGRKMTYTYDELNRLEAASDDLDNATHYAYDAAGNLETVTDAQGMITKYGYDELNRPIRVVQNFDDGLEDAVPDQDVITRYGYDKVSNRTVITDARHFVTRLVYDDLNRLKSRSDPLNHTWHYDYDAVGNLTQVTDANTQVTIYHYDDLNRLTTIDYPGAQGDVSFTYDAVGNRLTMTDPTGLTSYVYDELNRLTGVTQPNVGTVGYGYDGVGNLTQLDYPDARSVSYGYDAANRLETATDWSSGQYTYSYDDAGRPTGLSTPNTPGGTGGVTSSYHYDEAGRLVCMDYIPAGSPGQALASYRYTLDATGNRRQAVESEIPCITHTYLPIVLKDALGETIPSAPEGYNPIFNSPLPLPVETTPEPSPTPTPTPTLVASPSPALTPATELSATFTPEPTQGPTDEVITPTATLTATPSITSAVSQARSPGLAAPLPVRTWNLITWLWGELGRGMDWLGENLFNPGPVARGEVEQVASFVFSSPIGGQSTGGGVVIDYTYDDLYRLTGATYSNGQSFAYSYDAAGNRTQRTADGVVTNYAYDDANRLTSVNGVAYTYDDNGNLLNDGAHTFTYDAADRLLTLTGGGVNASYAYNGDGLRVQDTVNGVTTRYGWDVAAPIPQVIANSSGAAYVYGLGLLAQQQSGAWQYALPDGLGSVRHLVDPLGQVTQSYDFSPFGLPLGPGGGQPYGYAGEHWEAATGLVYLRARWYNPAAGRFLTRDPFPGLASLPDSQHPYVYVGNNPVNLTDPSGEIAPILVAAGVGAAIGGAAGGAGYVLAHPGGRPEDYLRSGAFWRAAGVGAASGAVAGVTGAWIGSVAAGTGLGGAVAGGILSGSASGVAGQVTANLLTPCATWHDYLIQSAIFGGLTGGIAGAAGWRIGQWRVSRLRSPAIDPADIVGRTPEQIDRIAQRAGLLPRGPNPRMGQGAYIDPLTGEQRILIHPFDAICGPHCHVNNAAGVRLDISGNPIQSNLPGAHLPIKWP